MPKPAKDIKPFLRYFVNLFRLQVTGKNDASDAVRVFPVEENFNGESIYEFKIRYLGAWKSRRMSIEPLGEKVESKSTCYKVVYDDLLVIKIPPRPITDFGVYLEAINREHSIARQIQKNIPCVYPQLGAILKKVPLTRLPSYVSAEASEEEYIALLSKKPAMQDFLKIGEGFVFFMTLSKYRFFNEIIDSIHHTADHTRREIVKNGQEAVSDFFVFESLYGTKNDTIYFNMHSVVQSYNKAAQKILQEEGAFWSVPDYKKQEWLFSHMAGLQSETGPGDLSEETFRRIEQMTRQFIEGKKPVITEFRKLVHKTAQNKNFYNNRSRIKGMVINLLELVYRLKHRHTAIRDLKPDNIYVAAFLDGADHILANPDAYDFGLIDLETAICFKPRKDGITDQPLLAGTPTYATPSHIFGNRVLRAIYKDELPRIFYLQDMHAAMVIIFKLVTGRSLFVKTSLLMKEISRLKKRNVKDFQGLLAVYRTSGRTFWKSAANEFDQQVQRYKHRLEDVEIDLPAHLRKFLILEYRHECRMAAHNGDKKRKTPSPRVLGALQAPVACDFLVEFMFNRIFNAMYRTKSKGKTPEDGTGPAEPPLRTP